MYSATPSRSINQTGQDFQMGSLRHSSPKSAPHNLNRSIPLESTVILRNGVAKARQMMSEMDSKSLQTLEFEKVLARLATYTGFSAGAELALRSEPTRDIREARRWQAQTREARQLYQNGSDLSVAGARDVRRVVDNAQRGFTLLALELLDVQNTLIAARTLKRHLLKVQAPHPELTAIAELIEECPALVTSISQTLDERGEVLDSASPKLANIRRELLVAHGRIHEKLRAILNSPLNKHLQEPIITMRSGRYVVPVRAESRGSIRGIVHDESGSGATLWVEPLNTVELNNQFRSLQIQEQKEIERILAELSSQVANNGEAIRRSVDRLAELDVIFARARYALTLDAVEPDFVEWRSAAPPHPGSTIWVRAARHPLLDPHTVVPTDFLVDERTFIVLITGPNTGGKTVSLKNIGLIVLMAQTGLHVPAVEARLTVFEQVAADIGDEQSIEQSLSTFSSHITNIVRILKTVDERTLVVLDELGSGTDPTEGAAIAHAITNYLRDKGATTFIATHYPELKLYASRTPGAVNASMLFDVETLSPTYELTIGIPGKSNALAIARRLGLDESILDEAMQLIGSGNREAESLLDSIYEMRDKIAAEEAGTRLALRSAESLRDQLADRLQAIDIERQQLLADARAQAEAELEDIREEIRRARKQVREAASLTSLKKVSKAIDQVEPAAAPPPLPLPALPAPATARRPRARTGLTVGDTVYVKSLKAEGQILTLDGKEAEIAIGRLHLRARTSELELREPEEEPVPEYTPSPIPLTARVGMELDLRGQRVEAGLQMLEQYLDSASLSNLPWVRIIHGKGTGRMRAAVQAALARHAYVVSWALGQDGEGGDGVTVARLAAEDRE